MNTLTKTPKLAVVTLLLLLTCISSVYAAVSITTPSQTVIGTVNTPLVNTATLMVSGFTGAVTYTVSPALSAGLALSSSSGVISGTPTVAKAATKYTVTATGTGGKATTTLTITISNPATLTPATQTITGYVGSLITASKALTATNFSGTVTYSVSPSLPVGLALNAATGVISGKPTLAQSAVSYTITGRGATSGSATTLVSIAVLTPSLSPAAQTLSGVAGKALTASSSLVSTGFTGVLSYAVSPSLPTGLVFSPTKGVISGIATVAAALNTYTITATGATGGIATALVNLSIAPPPPALSPATQTLNGVMNKAITPTKALIASNFAGAVSYSINNSLVAGLSFDSVTGIISGTPITTQALTAYTITATDGINTATATVNMTIVLPPPAISPKTQTVNGTVGAAIVPTTAFTASYFGGPVTYTSTTLPTGFTLDSGTGIITGIPVASQVKTNYTITATGLNGTATAIITIDVPPPVIAPTTQTVQGKINIAISPTRAYTASNFSGAVTYTISAALPDGLIFEPTTGVISGLSTNVATPTTYTITATDGISGTATATVNLTISPTITPARQTIKTPVNAPMAASALLTSTGFSGTVLYTLTPAVPSGLVFDTGTGVVSGTPDTPQTAANYIVTASDSSTGLIATSTLSITVTNPPNCLPKTLTDVEEGRRAYLRLNCYSCHGDAGQGGMGPIIAGEGGGVTDVVPNGSDQGMPGFSDYLCANDLTYLTAYLNALSGKNPPKFKHWWEQSPVQ